MFVTWFVIVGLQLIWLTFQLAYLYSTHHVDRLTPVDLATLYRNNVVLWSDKNIGDDAFTWDRLTGGQQRNLFWWQNWHDETRLANLPIRGTHHSATYTINSVLSLFAKTQKYTLLEQLNRGVRAFDIRLRVDDDKDLRAYHDIIDLGLSWRSIWTAIETWLRAYPREGILLMIRDETYKQHGIVANRALQLLGKRTRKRVLLNNRRFDRSADFTVGQLRGRIFLWNLNDRRMTVSWPDNREFRVGAIRASDRYDPRDSVAEKLEACYNFYERLSRSPVDQSFMHVLFTSMRNANLFHSIQTQAREINSCFHGWLVNNRMPIRGCVVFADWID